MSNIVKTKDGLVEKSTGRKIESQLDFELRQNPASVSNRLLTGSSRCVQETAIMRSNYQSIRAQA